MQRQQEGRRPRGGRHRLPVQAAVLTVSGASGAAPHTARLWSRGARPVLWAAGSWLGWGDRSCPGPGQGGATVGVGPL